MRHRVDFAADPRFNIELLFQLACQAGDQRFARVALAAGKLPEAFEVHAFLPARHEKTAVALDDGGGDDDGGHA
jgi:hypothetical protein